MKKRQYAYQFRCQLTKEQTVQFVQFAGCVRKVWNHFLSEIGKAEDRYKAKLKAKIEQEKLNKEAEQVKLDVDTLEKILSEENHSEIHSEEKQDKVTSNKKAKGKKSKKNYSYKGYHHYAKLLTKMKVKKKYFYLKDCPSQALQQTLINLDKGFQRFFKKEAEHPVFKKKAKYKVIHFPQKFQLFPEVNGKGTILLPKIGYVQYIAHRPLHPDFEIKNVYIREKAGHFYLFLQGEISEPDLVKQPSLRKVIGLDLGITHFFTSNQLGWIKPLNKYQQQLKRLQLLQRKLKTKTKFSTNWMRLQRQIAKKHHHIANCRKNFNHQLSRYLANRYDVVFLENLDIQAMLAKGKHKLNMQILDQGWFQFKTFLSYKMAWLNKKVIEVNPAYTSQTCAYCGHISQENRPTQAQFCCTRCGFTANADYQASLNIIKKGLKQLNKADLNGIFQELFRCATYQLMQVKQNFKIVVKQQKKQLTQLSIPHLGVC